jgi:hypothetical protein
VSKDLAIFTHFLHPGIIKMADKEAPKIPISQAERP